MQTVLFQQESHDFIERGFEPCLREERVGKEDTSGIVAAEGICELLPPGEETVETVEVLQTHPPDIGRI